MIKYRGGMAATSLQMTKDTMKEIAIKTQTLSPDLKVACEIWHYNTLNEPIWFTKLADSLSWCMDKKQILCSLDTLTDLMIIYGEYGETEGGRACKIWFVDTHNGSDLIIKELYNKIWSGLIR